MEYTMKGMYLWNSISTANANEVFIKVWDIWEAYFYELIMVDST